MSLKLRLRAQMIRPHIPKDFLPKEAKQSLKGTLPRMHAPQPLRLETGIPVKVSSARVIQGKPLKLPADIKTRRQSVREISHQSRSKARIYIPTARLPLTAHKAPKLRRSLSSRTIWFKEKTARIAPLQMKIRDGLKSHRVPGLKTSRAAQSFKVDKAVSYKVYKTKLRTSAKEVHKLIPIRYRASSYRMPLPDDIKPKKDHYPLSDSVQSLKASVDKSWKAVKEIKEASGEVLTKPPKPVKMSKVFNVSNGLKTTKPLKVSLDLKPKI